MVFKFADSIAVVVFLFTWFTFSHFADRNYGKKPNINTVMQTYRDQWMKSLVTRELKVIDTTIQTGILSGVAFFASTSILLVGGSLTVLGATDRALSIVSYLPFALPTSRTLWEVKVLLLVGIFTYAFFKFAWCYRLSMYTIILMGAAPTVDPPDDEAMVFANRVSALHGLGATHFNRGLRAYMYGLAAISWFIHPLALIASSFYVTFVLYRREFSSRSLRILLGG